MSAPEEPSPERGVGDDPVRGDHPAQGRAGVWLPPRRAPDTTSGRCAGSPVRSTNRAPRRSARALPTPRAPLPGAPINTASIARVLCRAARPRAVRAACRHRSRNPLDRRLRFRKIGPCPTLWNGCDTAVSPIEQREDGGPDMSTRFTRVTVALAAVLLVAGCATGGRQPIGAGLRVRVGGSRRALRRRRPRRRPLSS